MLFEGDRVTVLIPAFCADDGLIVPTDPPADLVVAVFDHFRLQPVLIPICHADPLAVGQLLLHLLLAAEVIMSPKTVHLVIAILSLRLLIPVLVPLGILPVPLVITPLGLVPRLAAVVPVCLLPVLLAVEDICLSPSLTVRPVLGCDAREWYFGVKFVKKIATPWVGTKVGPLDTPTRSRYRKDGY